MELDRRKLVLQLGAELKDRVVVDVVLPVEHDARAGFVSANSVNSIFVLELWK